MKKNIQVAALIAGVSVLAKMAADSVREVKYGFADNNPSACGQLGEWMKEEENRKLRSKEADE